MRRKAQRANARQGLAAPPLRATARIAAEAAPTGWPTPTNNGERALFIARTRRRKPAKTPGRLYGSIAGSIAARSGCDKSPRDNLPYSTPRTRPLTFACSLAARQFRLRLGLGLCLPGTFLSKHKKTKVDVSGVRQTFILCKPSANPARRCLLRRIPPRALPGPPPGLGANGSFLSQLRDSHRPIWRSKTLLCRGSGGARRHSRAAGGCRTLRAIGGTVSPHCGAPDRIGARGADPAPTQTTASPTKTTPSPAETGHAGCGSPAGSRRGQPG